MRKHMFKAGVALATAIILAANPVASVLPQQSIIAEAAAAKISAKKLSMQVGNTETLTVSNAGNKKIKWKSNKKAVATVSSDGVVTAVGAGSAKITAKVGKKKLVCKVTVTDPGTTNNNDDNNNTNNDNNNTGNDDSNNNNNNDNNASVTINQPKITYSTVDRQASRGDKMLGEQLTQAVIEFDGVPTTAEQLRKIDRSSGSGTSEDGKQDGKYLTVALALCALRAYTESSPADCKAMLNELLVSPSVPASSVGSASDVSYYLSDSYRAARIPWAFFDGANSGNKYTPSEPLSVTVEEYPYAPQLSTIYGVELYVEDIMFHTDTHSTLTNSTKVSVYQDPTDGQWYLWPSGFGGILTAASIR